MRDVINYSFSDGVMRMIFARRACCDISARLYNICINSPAIMRATSCGFALDCLMREARFCLHVRGARRWRFDGRRSACFELYTRAIDKAPFALGWSLLARGSAWLAFLFFPSMLCTCVSHIQTHTSDESVYIILKSHATDWRDYAPGSCSL